MLSDGERLADDVEQMTRGASIGPGSLEVDRENAIGAHFAQRPRWYRMREHAIDEITAANLHRQKHAGIGATGAHGIDDGAGVENDALPCIEISGGNAEWNAQIFKSLALESARQERDHAVVRSEPAA